MSENEVENPSVRPKLTGTFMHPHAQLATDVCHQIRKSLTTFRMYEPDHIARKNAEDELFASIAKATEEIGELALRVTANSIRWGDTAVYSEEGSQSDSLTRNLFMDGVHQILFLPGLLKGECANFLVLWHIAIHGRFPPGHSFSTRVWEEEFSFISLEVVESFADVLEATGSEGRSKREENIEQLSEMVISKEFPRSPPEGMIRSSNLPIAADVNVIAMQLENIASIRIDELPPYDPKSATPILPPSDEEKSEMVKQIRTSLQDSAGQRGLAILWAMLPLVSGKDDTKALERLVQRIFRMLIGEGAYDELDEAIKGILAMVRAVPARFPELEQFLTHLMTNEGLIHLVYLLEHENRQQFGLDILRYVPGNQLPRLVAQLPKMSNGKARKLLAGLIQKKRVSSETLIEELKRIGPQTINLDFLDELFLLNESVPKDDADQFINAGLAHLDRRVRTYTFNNLTKDRLSRYRERFYRLVADPSSDIWRLVLNNLVRLRDPGAVPHLIPILKKSAVSIENRKVVIRGLGAIGGEQAAESLEPIFMGKDNVGLRCAAALALGNIGDPEKLKRIFQKESKKLIGNKELKAACAEALRRMELKENKSST